MSPLYSDAVGNTVPGSVGTDCVSCVVCAGESSVCPESVISVYWCLYESLGG